MYVWGVPVQPNLMILEQPEADFINPLNIRSASFGLTRVAFGGISYRETARVTELSEVLTVLFLFSALNTVSVFQVGKAKGEKTIAVQREL